MTQRERQILNWIEENPLISQQELAEKAGITRSSVAVHISNLMKKGYITGKGYIVHTAPYVTVVGGVNMDIGGWPSEVPVDRDSNPGAVRMSLGGVGRNIAHNMSLLGLDVRMVTAFGDDLYAQKIAASCGELGIDISQSPVIPEGHTSTYLFINDEKGDMLLAVSDMDIYRHLTPQLLSQRQKLLSGSQVLVIDTNIPAESIAYLIFVACVKNVVSMEDIRSLIDIQKSSYEFEVAYNYFCAEFENLMQVIFGCREKPEQVGISQSNEKELLRAALLSVTFKLYLDTTFRLLQEE